VRTIQLTSGELTQVIPSIRDEELRALRHEPGYAGTLVLASRPGAASAERVEAIILWDDAHAMPPPATPSEARVYEVALSAGIPGGTVARFISAHLYPGNIDTVVTLFENVVMHAATTQLGFRRGLLMIDRAGDNAISIGLWQSEADLHASEQTGYLGQQIGNFTQIVAAPIVPETLVVVIEE